MDKKRTSFKNIAFEMFSFLQEPILKSVYKIPWGTQDHLFWNAQARNEKGC